MYYLSFSVMYFIKILILLLLLSNVYNLHCSSHLVIDNGNILDVLYRVSRKYKGKIRFPYKKCGKVPTSDFLPKRAGSQLRDLTFYQVIRLNRKGWTQGTWFSDKLEVYDIILYFKTLKSFSIMGFYIKSTKAIVQLQINDGKKHMLDPKRTRFCISGKPKCEKWGYRWNYGKHKLKFKLLSQWNQLHVAHLKRRNVYQFLFKPNKHILVAPFIPWNTTLDPACKKREDHLKTHVNHIVGFKLNMNFTYGRENSIERIIKCFKSIMSKYNIEHVVISGNYTGPSSIATFNVTGDESNKYIFFHTLLDRAVSNQCYEYACIEWNTMVPNITAKPGAFTKSFHKMNRGVKSSTTTDRTATKPVVKHNKDAKPNRTAYRVNVGNTDSVNENKLIRDDKNTSLNCGYSMPKHLNETGNIGLMHISMEPSQSTEVFKQCLLQTFGQKSKYIKVDRKGNHTRDAYLKFTRAGIATLLYKQKTLPCMISINYYCFAYATLPPLLHGGTSITSVMSIILNIIFIAVIIWLISYIYQVKRIPMVANTIGFEDFMTHGNAYSTFNNSNSEKKSSGGTKKKSVQKEEKD